MAYHEWGDDWFEKYGNDLYAAGNYIWDYVYRHSFCKLIYKEKYGTLRYEYIFPPKGSVRLSGIKLPEMFNKKVVVGNEVFNLPRYIWRWDSCNWLYRKWCNLGWLMVKRAVFKAIKKWPHLEDELLEDLAIHEKLVGKEIHKKYWRSSGDE